MTLVQNHQRQLNGNNTPSFFGLFFILIFASSCAFFKPVNSTTENNRPDFPKDLEGPKNVDPNTGEIVYNQQLDVDMDTISWKDGIKTSPVIISDAEMVFSNDDKDPNSYSTGMNIAFFLPFNSSIFDSFEGKVHASSIDSLHYHSHGRRVRRADSLWRFRLDWRRGNRRSGCGNVAQQPQPRLFAAKSWRFCGG